MLPTWMYLEDNMLMKEARSRRINTILFHLDEATKVVKFIETESRIEVSS